MGLEESDLKCRPRAWRSFSSTRVTLKMWSHEYMLMSIGFSVLPTSHLNIGHGWMRIGENLMYSWWEGTLIPFKRKI